ncbi:MAG: hypothetical protein PUD63_09610 [Clostridia bacterium]|nr:hypothetical protein [Clostridia bacterium]MDD6041433.1 hypothetical protein [Clostridia bacterium]
MDNKQLVEYMGHIVLLENAIQSHKKILHIMQERSSFLGMPAKIEKPILEEPILKDYDFWGFTLFFIGLIGSIIGIAIYFSLSSIAQINIAQMKWLEIISISCLCIGLFACLLRKNGNTRMKKETEEKNQNKQGQYDQAIQMDRSRCNKEEEIRIDLSSCASALAKNLSELQARLDNLYNQGIIFPDFRGIIPTTYMYRYLASGICTGLEGADGAYAQYLQDDRANRIVHRLDAISNLLAKIQLGQQAQLRLLSNIQFTLSGIEQSLGAIHQSINQIQQQVSDLVNIQVDANTYINGIGKQLNRIANEVDMAKINSHVIAMNQYRASIEQGVDAYCLKYPV